MFLAITRSGSSVRGRSGTALAATPAAGTAMSSALIPLPAALLPLVLLVEPGPQGGEVVEDGRGVHFRAAGHGLERLRPGAALAHLEHPGEDLPRFFIGGDRAAVERTFLPRRLAEAAVEVELQDVGQEIAGVGDVPRHVILGARIEV